MEFDHLANLIQNCFTDEGIVNLAMGQAAISEEAGWQRVPSFGLVSMEITLFLYMISSASAFPFAFDMAETDPEIKNPTQVDI